MMHPLAVLSFVLVALLLCGVAAEPEEKGVKDLAPNLNGKFESLIALAGNINKEFAAQGVEASVSFTTEDERKAEPQDVVLALAFSGPILLRSNVPWPVEKEDDDEEEEEPNEVETFEDIPTTAYGKPAPRAPEKPESLEEFLGIPALAKMAAAVKSKFPAVELDKTLFSIAGAESEEIDVLRRSKRNIAAPLVVEGGISTGCRGKSGGTLGGLFISTNALPDGQRHLFAVTNRHVYRHAANGDRVCQPNERSQKLAGKCAAGKYRISAAGLPGGAVGAQWAANGCCRPLGQKVTEDVNSDCAMARINDPDDGWGLSGKCAIQNIGDVSGKSLWSRYVPRVFSGALGLSVKKMGYRTHYTDGNVYRVNGGAWDYRIRGVGLPAFAGAGPAAYNAVKYPGCFSPANEPHFCRRKIINAAAAHVIAITAAEPAGAYSKAQARQVVRGLLTHASGPLLTMASEKGDSGSFWVNENVFNNRNYVVALHYSGRWEERKYSILTRWSKPYYTDHNGRRWYGLDKYANAKSIHRVENALSAAAGYPVEVCDERVRAAAGINT